MRLWNQPVMYGLGLRQNVEKYRAKEQFFTKNRFSVTFPVAFLFYIGEEAKEFPPYYVMVGAREPEPVFELAQVPVFGGPNAVLPLASKSDELLVAFEPANDLSGLKADVLFKKKGEVERSLFFEVKLTVVPDSATISDNESEWGPEIVVRRANYSSALASALHAVSDRIMQGAISIEDVKKVIELLSDSPDEGQLKRAFTSLIAFLAQKGIQRPFLLNPLWWSEVERDSGSVRAIPRLPKEGAFDYLAWSDLAFLAMPLRSLRGGRKMRALLKAVLAFKKGLERLSNGEALQIKDLVEIVDAANADSQEHVAKKGGKERQTDKEFSVSGKLVYKFISEAKAQAKDGTPAKSCELFKKGRLGREDVLQKVIFQFTNRDEVLSYLAPERRLDQAVLFTLTEKGGANGKGEPELSQAVLFHANS
jgi:hypothetical protein